MPFAARCAQCLLPVGRRALTLRVGEATETFCCYGCYLVLRLTSERGPDGIAHGIALRLGLALFFAMNAMMFSLPGYFPYMYGGAADAVGFLTGLRIMALLLTLPVLLLLGVPVLWQALRDAREGVVRTDALVAVGTIAAYAVSVHHTIIAAPHVYFDTVAMLLIFVAIGRYLEARAKADAGAVLARLRDATRQTVQTCREGQWQSLPVQALRAGDLIALGPGDLCPVDGTIASGTADFDEATLTGESVPVGKAPGQTVLAGSTNLDGNVHLRADRVGADSTVGRLRHSVEDALAEQSDWQRTADRLAGVLVVTAPLLAAVTFVYWTQHGSAEHALLTALAVLVVACPCAFGIATPAALWVGIDEAARRGILLRSAGVLERLSQIRTVWFDKTGTLSTGQLRLTNVKCLGDTSLTGAQALSIARALELRIPHPIAEALHTEQEMPLAATDVRYHPGLGVEGHLQGARWHFGNRALHARLGAVIPIQLDDHDEVSAEWTSWLGHAPSDNAPPIIVARFRFVDQPRPEVADTLHALQRAGMTIGILSGAAALGHSWQRLLRTYAVQVGMLPHEKAAQVRRSEGSVAMVGDGLNDAPALATADVGIALGAGRDLTRDAADVNILCNDLGAVAWLFRWSRIVHRTMCVNVCWALLYNGAALTAAATGNLNPVIAALAMIGSSTFIVANARRLHRAASVSKVQLSSAEPAIAVTVPAVP